ncbi:DsbA family protein [Kaistia terrae]|uniref:DsbA family protein n=1 Tax=Kaistia terrae TaxID=537017 RepID=A0ABW0PYS0_9HYPH|nr:DsbA family protein [Kaistia terrae]MCX5581687.1 DsbA family protein [Kaistia terrae]
MIDKPLITYLFDPLCGWCYGASPALRRLAAHPGISIELAPTGLFSGLSARPMDSQFAAYAWSNDQRIAELSGQRFSADYREKVLGHNDGRLDSGPATLALTAVALTQPSRELDALRLIQEARYVSGLDVTDRSALGAILTNADLGAAAGRFAALDKQLLAENSRRVEAARAAMRAFGAHGVPALLVDDRQGRRLIEANALFANPALLDNLASVAARTEAHERIQP